MTVVLDANVLIAHFDPADRHHAAAVALLSSRAGQSLLAHPITIAEVLVGPARAGRARERRDSIRSMRVKTAAVDDDAPVRLAELRARTSHRMPDCCVLDAAIRHRATLATFDTGLAASGRAMDLEVLPASSAPDAGRAQ